MPDKKSMEFFDCVNDIEDRYSCFTSHAMMYKIYEKLDEILTELQNADKKT
jgi:hypothetical protein